MGDQRRPAGPHRRTADRSSPGPDPDTFIRVLDYESYFLVIEFFRTDPGNDFQISATRRVGRRAVATYGLDGYASGSAMAPGSAYPGFLYSLQVARYSDPDVTVAFEAGVLPDDAVTGDHHRLELSDEIPHGAVFDVPWETAGPVAYGLRLETASAR